MLLGEQAILLNLLSIAVLAFVVGSLLTIAALKFVLPGIQNLEFRTRKILLWLMVTAPWWIALCCMMFFWLRQHDYLFTAWVNEFAHWHHVDIFMFTSWHAITLYCAGLFIVSTLIKTLFSIRKQALAMSDMLSLSEIRTEKSSTDADFYTLAVNIPVAFTAGILSPKIYVTTDILERINGQELDIIVRHETAHVVSYDPFFKLVFSIFSGFYPASIRKILNRQFTLLTEQMADHAVTYEHDNLDVAQTLINVARMQRRVAIDCNGMQASFFTGDQTSVRVERLINPALPTSRYLLCIALILLASAPLLTASTVDSLHHFIETLFTH